MSAVPKLDMSGSLVLSADRIVEVASYDRRKYYGIGTFRGEVLPYGSRWSWRAWQAISRDLGGKGTIAKGVTQTKAEAIELCLGALRSEMDSGRNSER
jgi:hypothetical protein